MITEELKKRVADFMEKEQRSGSMSLMTAEYVARCIQIAKVDWAIGKLRIFTPYQQSIFAYKKHIMVY